MPTTAGVYTADLENGTQVSSTYEGRHLTMVEDELMHPLHAADAFVDKGDPVVIARALGATPHTAYGLAVGVAFNDASALTDMIAIDTEGIFNLNVNAFDDNGGIDVNPGDALFISDDSVGSDDSSHDGVGNCVISKIRNNVTQIPFGYALGYIGSGAYGVIAVKVHWDPRAHWLMDDEPLLFGYGAAANGDMTLTHDGTDLTLVGLVNGGAFVIGNGTESMDVQIFGATAAEYLLWDSSENELTMISEQISATPAADSAAFKLTLTNALAQTNGRLCAMSVNLEPTAALAAEALIGLEVVTNIPADVDVAHMVQGLFVNTTGGLSFAEDVYGARIHFRPLVNPTGESAVLRLDSNVTDAAFVDAFLMLDGDAVNAFVFHPLAECTAWSVGTAPNGAATGHLHVNVGGVPREIPLYTPA